MKRIIDFFPIFTQEEWALMIKKYGSEIKIKEYLYKRIDAIIDQECEDIRRESNE